MSIMCYDTINRSVGLGLAPAFRQVALTIVFRVARCNDAFWEVRRDCPRNYVYKTNDG